MSCKARRLRSSASVQRCFNDLKLCRLASRAGWLELLEDLEVAPTDIAKCREPAGNNGMHTGGALLPSRRVSGNTTKMPSPLPNTAANMLARYRREVGNGMTLDTTFPCR
eukprot:2824309-Pyramimonas_sp.AAC.1